MVNKFISYLFLITMICAVNIYCMEEMTLLDVFVKDRNTAQWKVGLVHAENGVSIALHLKDEDAQTNFDFLGNEPKSVLLQRLNDCNMSLVLSDIHVFLYFRWKLFSYYLLTNVYEEYLIFLFFIFVIELGHIGEV